MSRSIRSVPHLPACLLLVHLLTGCATATDNGSQSKGVVGSDASLLGAAGGRITAGRPQRGEARNIVDARTSLASAFVDVGRDADKKGAAEKEPDARVVAEAGNYSLNFVDIELQEFVRAAFDEVLHQNVVVDPSLTGHVTVRTSQPVPRATAQQLVTESLRAAGAVVTQNGSVWRVSAGTNSGGRFREAVRVIQLQFIDAASASQALQPFGAGAGAEITLGGNGHFLIVAGKPTEVEAVQQVVSSFDIDELRGRSFALIPLKEAAADAVSRDLAQMIATSGVQQARILPLERMNALMIVAKDPALIARIRGLVQHLDKSGQEQRKVYVYPVKNRRAAEIASVLEGMFKTQKGLQEGPRTESTLAPGLSAEKVDVPALRPSSSNAAAGTSDGGGLRGTEASPFGSLPASLPNTLTKPHALEGVEIRADSATNTLIILCKEDEHKLVESAIRNMDVLPAQVLIEVTIAEVRLNEALSHGVGWFFQAGHHSVGTTNPSDGTAFTYSFGVPNAQLAIQALESVTKVEILSAPALTVLDNQTAMLKVGDQVPIQTRSSQSVATADAPVVSDITLKDTGIILKVTPRINSSGLVLLDIDQEDSDVVPTTSSNINSPTIRQRQITSSVAVQSGAEIVLGGIITRGAEHDKSGLPFLNGVPVLGDVLAKSAMDSNNRTELLVVLRPTIMANQSEVYAVTQEVKRRMRESMENPHLRQ